MIKEIKYCLRQYSLLFSQYRLKSDQLDVLHLYNSFPLILTSLDSLSAFLLRYNYHSVPVQAIYTLIAAVERKKTSGRISDDRAGVCPPARNARHCTLTFFFFVMKFQLAYRTPATLLPVATGLPQHNLQLISGPSLVTIF